MWCNSIENTGKPNVSLFKEFKARWGGGKARTSVQLGQKLKHPTIEFAAISGSGCVALSPER